MFGSASYTATFNPLTYEDFAKPLLMYKQEVDSLGDAYGQLGDLANQYANSIDKNSKAYATMQDYNEGLGADVEDLFNNGLNNVNKSKFLQRRNQYQQDIMAINTAAKKLDDQKTLAQKLSTQGIISFDMPTIDEIIENPMATPKTIDTKTMVAAAAQEGKNINDSQTKIALQQLDKYHNITKVTKGLNEEQKKVLMDSPGVKNFIEQYLSGTGVSKEKNPELYQQLENQMLSGVMSSIREETQFGNIVNNEDTLAQLDISKQKEILALKAQADANNNAKNKFDFLAKTYPVVPLTADFDPNNAETSSGIAAQGIDIHGDLLKKISGSIQRAGARLGSDSLKSSFVRRKQNDIKGDKLIQMLTRNDVTNGSSKDDFLIAASLTLDGELIAWNEKGDAYALRKGLVGQVMGRDFANALTQMSTVYEADKNGELKGKDKPNIGDYISAGYTALNLISGDAGLQKSLDSSSKMGIGISYE